MTARDARKENAEMADEQVTTSNTATEQAAQQDGNTEMVSMPKMEQAKIMAALKDAQADALKFRLQVRELLPKAEKGSELEKSLADLTSKLESSDRRAQFVESAVTPEIGCRNPKAAWALAMADNLFTRNGSPDWAAIKAAAPELFTAPAAKSNAGEGTGSTQPVSTMNDFIRRRGH